MINKPSFEIRKFGFNSNLLPNVSNNKYVDGLWPLIYILSDGGQKEAYVGETTDALARFSNHLRNNSKNISESLNISASQKLCKVKKYLQLSEHKCRENKERKNNNNKRNNKLKLNKRKAKRNKSNIMLNLSIRKF